MDVTSPKHRPTRALASFLYPPPGSLLAERALGKKLINKKIVLPPQLTPLSPSFSRCSVNYILKMS